MLFLNCGYATPTGTSFLAAFQSCPFMKSGARRCIIFAMSEFEDAAIGQALQFLSRVGRADQNRLLVLRGGSNYTVQPEGETPAQFLASQNSAGLSGFQEALNDLYEVGSIVAMRLTTKWNTYADQIPSP